VVSTLTDLFLAVLLRDLRLAARRRIECAAAAGVLPRRGQPVPAGRRAGAADAAQIAPGIVWVCALLAAMLSVNSLLRDRLRRRFAGADAAGAAAAVGRGLRQGGAHWLITGLPLIVATPVIGLLFDMSAPALGALVAGLLLGTPILSLLGGAGRGADAGAAQRGHAADPDRAAAGHAGADLRGRRRGGGGVGPVGLGTLSRCWARC
jgi:heme exporter protein B